MKYNEKGKEEKNRPCEFLKKVYRSKNWKCCYCFFMDDVRKIFTPPEEGYTAYGMR